ncbi:MAG: hypothetical protein EOO22_21695 [Comamonadaceae bacterium]|nr:MAG: hypothetical protein EOO22_21695 [Comamonadaceae bacterium]
MSKPDSLPNGAAYEIGAALFAALVAEEALTGAKLLDNPVRASSLQDGDRIVFFEDVSDGPAAQDKPLERVYRYNVGVINRTESSRLGSHRDYRTAKRTLKSALPRLKSIVQVANHREGEIAFRLENVDVGGGLVLGTFTLTYRDSDVFNV